MAVGIGNLDRRIALYNYTSAKDAYGADIKTYSLYASVWAKVEVLGGSEGQQDLQELAIRNVKFTIRYNSSINENTKVTYESKDYDIVNIQEVGRRNYLVLTTTLRTNQ